MTSPDSKQPSEPERGGALPALLAGAGILIVAALFIFNGDKGETKSEAEARGGSEARSAGANTARRAGQGGVAAREVDDATSRPGQPRLNPRLASGVVGKGMAPDTGPREDPTSFDSPEEARSYWERELDRAHAMLDTRERNLARADQLEQRIRSGEDPDGDLARLQEKRRIVEDNLARAQARVEEVESRLAGL